MLFAAAFALSESVSKQESGSLILLLLTSSRTKEKAVPALIWMIPLW
jgi:hypothetical protein